MSLCGQKDESGRRCKLGAGHGVAHRFGSARLTEGQTRRLRWLSDSGPCEAYRPDPSMVSLVGLGLATRQFIGMGYWRYAITVAGRETARMLPN